MGKGLCNQQRAEAKANKAKAEAKKAKTKTNKVMDTDQPTTTPQDSSQLRPKDMPLPRGDDTLPKNDDEAKQPPTEQHVEMEKPQD
jgi:hypothetical protein